VCVKGSLLHAEKQPAVIRDPKAHQQRTAMVDPTQQYSADFQEKSQEEDILEISGSERSKTHDKRIALAEWEIAQANRIMGVAASNNDESSTERRTETEDNIASVRTQETQRIRTPHPHDVFSGRGDVRGPIYQHAGNVQFRAWVLERKTSFLLAPLYLKARIAREVFSLVQNQNPPGRFLKSDPTHAGWWTEVDDGKAMEKIRLALRRREAPQTLDAHSEKPESETVKRPEKRSRFDGNGEAEPLIDETVPVRWDNLGNAEVPVRQARTERAGTEDGIASARTQETAKIRTLHPHDVLSGHGDSRGPIFLHSGYVQFRAWVSERKRRYLLSSYDEKTHIAREIISLVQNQDPPGRFLKADPTHAGWWMEVDDAKAMEKTRLALRRQYCTQTLGAHSEKVENVSVKQDEFERPEKRSRFDGNGEAEPPIDETAPVRWDDLGNAEVHARQTSTERSETDYDITSVRTQETAKKRTPHPHDVLYGRGDIRGSIYQHAGNVQFRAWISERKPSYVLASLDEKTCIAREVISLVQNQDPPGRFLKPDPTHTGWWMEVDDSKAMETKIRRELLRLGATQSLAGHSEKTKNEPGKQEEFERPEKRVRIDGNTEVESPIDETAPARLDDPCNAEIPVRQASTERSRMKYDIASVRTQETARIHTPHPHDVLFGEGDTSYHHLW
jgi:hypothetical protein